MDLQRFATLTRTLSSIPSRRDVVRGLVGAGLGLGMGRFAGPARAKKAKPKSKPKPNEYGCLEVGDVCNRAGQCCSGICKGKPGKKTCPGPTTPGTCEIRTNRDSAWRQTPCSTSATTSSTAVLPHDGRQQGLRRRRRLEMCRLPQGCRLREARLLIRIGLYPDGRRRLHRRVRKAARRARRRASTSPLSRRVTSGRCHSPRPGLMEAPNGRSHLRRPDRSDRQRLAPASAHRADRDRAGGAAIGRRPRRGGREVLAGAARSGRADARSRSRTPPPVASAASVSTASATPAKIDCGGVCTYCDETARCRPKPGRHTLPRRRHVPKRVVRGPRVMDRETEPFCGRWSQTRPGGQGGEDRESQRLR